MSWPTQAMLSMDHGEISHLKNYYLRSLELVMFKPSISGLIGIKMICIKISQRVIRRKPEHCTLLLLQE